MPLAQQFVTGVPGTQNICFTACVGIKNGQPREFKSLKNAVDIHQNIWPTCKKQYGDHHKKNHQNTINKKVNKQTKTK